MKKHYILLIISLLYSGFGLWANEPDTVKPSGKLPPVYCSASGSPDWEKIASVNFNGTSNTSADLVGYSDFTSVIFGAGTGQNYSISITTSAFYPQDRCVAWADWNQDGDFTDAGESISFNIPTTEGPYNATVAVPANAVPGQVRLRITLYDSEFNSNVTACDNVSYGEVEDYTINVSNIRYLKAGASGSGSSWANASGNLQAMINASPAGGEVWVAAGTHTSTSYIMKEGVKIYGGFPATGTPGMAQRDWTVNPTILQGNNTDYVIKNISNQLTNAAVLDGFTITAVNSPNFSSGILNYGVSPVFRNLVITGISGSTGAGVSNQISSPVFINVVIRGNTSSQSGGAMANYNCPLVVLTNVVITGNSSASQGGGILNVESSLFLTNVTISGNTSVHGGGMYNIQSTISMRNSIVYNNSNGVENPNSSFVAYYSLVQGMGANSANHNIDGAANPLFVAGSYALQPSSGCINMGSNSYFAAGQSPDISTITKDVAGNPRIYGTAIDMGAYENQSLQNVTTRYVKPGAVGNGYSWANATGDLQAAIGQSAEGNQVWVAAGTYQPVTGQYFSMKEGVKIYGGFAASGTPTIDQRNWAANSTVLQGNNNSVIVNESNDLTNNAVLDGFTITGGSNNDYGGGIRNVYVSPYFANLVIRSNSGNVGGAVYNNGASPVFVNTVMRSNTAAWGGGNV